MPTYTTTAKHLLRKLSGTSLVSEIDDGFTALADDVDAKIPYRESKIIPGEESTASTSYVFLTTNDKINGLVVPAKALIRVSYEALFRATIAVASSGNVGDIKLVLVQAGTPIDVAVPFDNGVSGASGVAALQTGGPLTSTLIGAVRTGGSADPGNGNVWAGAGGGGGNAANSSPQFARGAFIEIEAAAGTYDVGVQVKARTGWTLFVKERKLRVEVVPFV